MKKASKSQLKARMFEYFRQVEETGEPLVITDHGTPVLKVVPIRERRTPADVFRDLRGRVAYHEDPLAPTTDEWDDV